MKIKFEKKEFTEEEFWRAYLSLIDSKRILTNKEFEAMIIILSSDPYKSMFSSSSRKTLSKKTKIGLNNLSTLKSKLIEKGYLQNTEEIRGDSLVTSKIRDLQLKVKEQLKNKKSLTLGIYFDSIY